MIDQNFGHKELYEVVLRAKNPMQFGDRHIEAEEPVLYFDDIQMSVLSEQNLPVFARGGFGNTPRVIWDDRSEVSFQMVDGTMSLVGMSILLSSNVLAKQQNQPLYVHKIDGPFELTENGYIYPKHWPVASNIRKTFIFDYDRDAIQKKIYGRLVHGVKDPFDDTVEIPCVQLFQDKNCETLADNSRKYLIDYYYEYEDEALIYAIQKERFNGLFILEAKFYSKDENEGKNYTNVLYMPKVRIVSNINLRLGERADPTVSTFNIIGMPETVGDQKNLIMEITRLGHDIDGDI